MQIIEVPEGMPEPAGHYAAAVREGELIYLSATLPLGRNDAPVTPQAPFDIQMQQLLNNCADILAAAGSARQQVISFTLYLTDLSKWESADAILAKFFGAHRMARAVLCVSAIRKGYAVQASLIARVGSVA